MQRDCGMRLTPEALNLMPLAVAREGPRDGASRRPWHGTSRWQDLKRIDTPVAEAGKREIEKRSEGAIDQSR